MRDSIISLFGPHWSSQGFCWVITFFSHRHLWKTAAVLRDQRRFHRLKGRVRSIFQLLLGLYTWAIMSAELRPLDVFWCFGCFGTSLGSSRSVPPSRWQQTGEVEINWMPFKPQNVMDADVMGKRKKYNPMRWNSKWIKLILERDWISVCLSATFEH